VLSGLLLNVALYALLRFKMLLALIRRDRARPVMLTMGYLLRVRAFMLYRRRDINACSPIRRSSTWHIVFAFAWGAARQLAGLLHMTMHSLTKSAIFFAVGHIAQVKARRRSPTSAASP